MDILNRLLGHSTWTTQHLLERCRELTPEQLHQQFDIGHQSALETTEHLVDNIETWTDLMLQRPIRQYPADIQHERKTMGGLIARHAAAADEFGKLARQLAEENRMDDVYSDFLDNPPKLKSFGGTIAHVLTHNHQHRAELMHILTRLGVTDVIEGDVLGWESQMQFRVCRSTSKPPSSLPHAMSPSKSWTYDPCCSRSLWLWSPPPHLHWPYPTPPLCRRYRRR